MVFLTRISLHSKGKRQWIDSLRVYVRGGFGGNGLPGVNGVGGSGGDVYVKADETIKSLLDVRKKNPRQRYIAEAGENSSKHKCMGSSGSDVVIRAPLGVSLVTDHGQSLGELVKADDLIKVARGGPGGSKSSEYMGIRGEALSVKLDLKLLADVGLVGFPNAGKSTLLKAISRARPKIASYPFTTIRPNIGIAEFKDLRRITLADLPGLIEGASQNLGMGHRFLKHVERTRLLLFVVDINGFQFKVNTPHRSALDTVLLLNKELELYKEELVSKPAVLAITKMDSKGSDKKFVEFENDYKDAVANIQSCGLPSDSVPNKICYFDEIIPISAKHSQKSVEHLKSRLRYWMDQAELKNTEDMIEELNQKVSLKCNQDVIY